MDDLISRKSALEGMSFSEGLEVDGILYVPLRDVRKHLRNLASAEPEQKKGRWRYISFMTVEWMSIDLSWQRALM